jgi:hypothetical protein
MAASSPGLPDASTFSDQKSTIWKDFGGPWNGKMLIHFMSICNIFRPFDTSYGHVVIWYIFHFFVGTLHQEKSGNPDRHGDSGAALSRTRCVKNVFCFLF